MALADKNVQDPGIQFSADNTLEINHFMLMKNSKQVRGFYILVLLVLFLAYVCRQVE